MVQVSVVDGDNVFCRRTGADALERLNGGCVHDHVPSTTGDREGADVEVCHRDGLGDDRRTRERNIACGDVREGPWVHAVHGDVASGDGVKHCIGAGRSVARLRVATRDEPEVGRSEVNVGHRDAAHGVDAGVGVAVHINVVQNNVGVGTEHGVNGHTGLGRWVGDGHVQDRDVLQVNIDEVHVRVLHGQVLCVECTSG